MADLRGPDKEAARWRVRHRGGTSTAGAIRGSEDLELLSDPAIADAPPELVLRALFTKETLADYLRVSVYTVQRLVQDGALTAIKVGNQVRFHIDDVERFLDQSRKGGSDGRGRPGR